MKQQSILLLLLLCLSLDGMAQRKKVGLVLGGGGAKGAAHVGVLKVLEEAGIPIDYIAGTSIGSIVGGLYSVGYSVTELDTLFRTQNWISLLSDQVQRRHRSFAAKEMREKYLVSLPFSKDQKTELPAGVMSGQNIYNLFSDMTIGYHNVASFDSLPIPFACVAVDLVSGRPVILNKGSLPLAMRASMSIPGIYAPIETDGMVLIDGGALNNLPTNVVRAMGADILIGVDLSNGWKSADQVKTMFGMIDQMVNIMGEENYQQNKADLDLYLNPNLQGYTAANFTNTDISVMMQRGEREARAKWNELMLLKKRIYLDGAAPAEQPHRHGYSAPDSMTIAHILFEGISPENEVWIRKRIDLTQHTAITIREINNAISTLYGTDLFAKVEYRITTGTPSDLLFTLKEKPKNQLNIGFRFDSEDMASILLNTSFSNLLGRGSSLAATTRLNQDPYLLLSCQLGSNWSQKFELSYLLKFNDFRLYSDQKKLGTPSFISQSAKLSYSNTYHALRFKAGLCYELFSYNDPLYTPAYQPVEVTPEGFFCYFGSLKYDNLDQKYYPTRGVYAHMQGEVFTDNLFTYQGDAPFATVMFNFTTALSATDRFCVLPSLQGRFLIGDHIPPIYQNYLGGNIGGRYLPQQMAFSGIRYMQVFDDAVFLAKLALRYRIGSGHYISASGNYARESDRFLSLLDGSNAWGTALRYSYSSIIGPIGLEVNYSNRGEKVGVYFNLGYDF
ncbi:MAG: patatin-like phospholipase family protein [Alistipes sp.]